MCIRDRWGTAFPNSCSANRLPSSEEVRRPLRSSTSTWSSRLLLCHPTGDLMAGREPKLAQDAVNVRLDRALGDHEPGRDVFVAEPFGEQLRDLQLAAGQPPGSPGAEARGSGLVGWLG